MKLSRLIVLAGLLVPWLLMAFHAESLAQAHITGQKVDPGRVDVGLHGVVNADSSVSVIGATSPGVSLPINDTNRDRDLVLKQGPWQFTLTPGNYDSTAALDTRGWNRISVMFTYTFHDTTDPVGTIRGSPYGALFALQVSGGITQATDNLSTAQWLWRTAASTPSVLTDSIGTQTANEYWATQSPDTSASANVLGAGEIPIFIVAPGRKFGVSSTSTNVFAISAHQRALKRAPPSAKWFDLTDRQTGQPFRAPYTSMRLRLIACYDSLGAAYTKGPNSWVTGTITIVGTR